MNPPPTRKTLNEVITAPKLPPEAIALIKAGTPTPQTTVPLAASAAAAPQENILPKSTAETAEAPKLKTQKEREPQTISYVAMTVRVPQHLPKALLKASSDRKLKKIEPFTQQAIIAEALTRWLRENGYQPEKN